MESLRTFLDAAEAVLEAAAAYGRASAAALRQRVEWITEAATQQGDAAGCRRAARAALPPLVTRLRLTGDDGARLLSLASTPPPLGAPLPPFVVSAG
jgi:hypothetical protein